MKSKQFANGRQNLNMGNLDIAMLISLSILSLALYLDFITSTIAKS